MSRTAWIAISFLGVALSGAALISYRNRRVQDAQITVSPTADLETDADELTPVDLEAESKIAQAQTEDHFQPPLVSRTSRIGKKQGKKWSVLQTSVTNLTDQRLTIGLWGANRSASVRVNGVPMDQLGAIPTPIGGYLQAIAVNEQTGHLAIADQLNGSVLMVQPSGDLIATVQLEPTFPGLFSPSSIAIDNQTGKTYVAGAIADQVAVIGADFQVEAYYTVGSRPMSIAQHPSTRHLAVANYADNTLTLLDPVDGSISATASTGQGPLSVACDPASGKIYVANSVDNSITVTDEAGTFVRTIPALGDGLRSVLFNPATGQIYALAQGSEELFRIDPSSDQVVATIQLSNAPSNFLYHPGFKEVGVSYGADGRIEFLTDDGLPSNQLTTPKVGFNLVASPAGQHLFYSNPLTGEVYTVAGAGELLRVSEDYEENNRDFQLQPATVRHLRLAFSGSDRPDILHAGRMTSTGNLETAPVSINQFFSPMHVLNMADITSLRGSQIDGSTEWSIDILPRQTITMLLQYRQFDRFQWVKSQAS